MPSRLNVVVMSLLLATPAVAFWLWLVIVPARVAVLCPEECRCDTAGYFVGCSDRSLTAVPLIHLTDFRGLNLSYNKIIFLVNDSFFSMTELELLVVNACGLKKIHLGAFNGLTKLTHLLISNNSISEIIPGTFEFMNILENLDLSFNRLQHLGSGVFSGLGNLHYIDLSVNQLQYLHPDIFIGSPNLQKINLHFNRRLQLRHDSNLINSKVLSHLDLSDCNISSVSVETFANVSALESINLSNNNLTTVDVYILRKLPKLSQLYMTENPLHCDCQLQKLWTWCEDRNIDTGTGQQAPHCYTPTEVERMCWGVLESGQCLEGNVQYYGDYRNKSCNYSASGEYKKDYDAGFLSQYQVPIYIFPFIFGTTGNVILLIIIISNKDMRTVPNMYIINLAISDILYLTVFFSEVCAKRILTMWLGGKFTCLFFSFCRRLSVGLSFYSVALYNIQRYRVTAHPFHVRVSSAPSWRNFAATFCGVWIVAASFAVPSILSRNLCQQIMYTKLVYYKHVVIFELLVFCVLPLCVIAFTYTMTARQLMESCLSISDGAQNPQHQTRRNTAKIVVGLTVVFLISYVPYHVFWTYFICKQKENFSPFSTIRLNFSRYKFQYTYLISNCFLLINPCLNPVALFCTSSQFRQHLKRYLTCFCKTKNPPNVLDLARIN